jgi:hypothetical protein
MIVKSSLMTVGSSVSGCGLKLGAAARLAGAAGEPPGFGAEGTFPFGAGEPFPLSSDLVNMYTPQF